MADCYAAPEVDDLHRRWLPREIFADIGIADAAAAAAPLSPSAEDIAAHLTAGMLGVDAGKAATAAVPPPAAPPPPTGPAPYQQQQHAAQVCGLEGRVLLAYGGGSNGARAAAAAAAAAAVAWPFFPYAPVQWQVAANFGGVLLPRYAPLRPNRGPPPAKRRLGGTGVFLPRAEVYQYQHKSAAAATKSPAKEVKPPKERLDHQQQQQQQQRRDEEATGTKQRWQQDETAAAAEVMMHQQQQQKKNASGALIALPQEWTY